MNVIEDVADGERIDVTGLGFDSIHKYGVGVEG